MTDYTLTAATGALTIAGQTPTSIYGAVAADTTTLLEVMNVGVPVSLATTVTLSSTLDRLYCAVATVIDQVVVSANDSEAMIYSLAAFETVVLKTLTQVGALVTLTDTVTLSSVLQTAYAVWLLDSLHIQSVAAVQAKYNLSLLDLVTLNDGLWRFLSAIVSENVTVASALTPTYCAVVTAQDAVILSEALSGNLLAQVVLADTVDMTDAQLIQAIFSGELTDCVTVTFGYVSPDGSFTTWAINTRTNAVTEYRNWAFNSFARMGRKYIAASSEGLYELDGVDDDGASIDAYIRSGLFAPGGSRLSAFKAAYLGLRINDGGQDVYLKLTTGDDQDRVYRVRANDMNTTRVDFGKGLRSRWWAWELEVSGADFDLDSVVFVPLVASRRIG